MKKMMFAFLALFLVSAVCTNDVYAQKKKDKKENVQESVVPPQFKGKSAKAFMSWLYSTLEDKWKTHTDYQGQAIITFIVGIDGKVSNFELKKGTGIVVLDNMIRDIVLSSPEWTPKMVNGAPVAHRFTLPVTFKGVSKSKFSKPQNVGRTNEAAKNVRGWQR